MDEVERLVTLLEERVTVIMRRLDALDEKADSQRSRVNAILGSIVVAAVLLAVNAALHAL